jgi:predicted CXXCH cytochrome family protein
MIKLIVFGFFGILGIYNMFYNVLFDSHSNNLSSNYSKVESNSRDFTDQTSHFTSSGSSIDSLKSCMDCHEDLMRGEEAHSPSKKDCLRCHIDNGAEHPLDKTAGFNLKKSVPDLCYECHDPKNEEEFVHEPAGEGDCLLCHDVHSSDNLYLVKTNPVSDICYECHDLEIPKNNLIHGAVSDGECAGCHNPHQADNKDFIATTRLDRLCKKCHKSIRKELKKEHIHDPFKKKKCFDCHNAHSSKEAHLSDFKTIDLCYSCHDEVHKQVDTAKFVHGAISEPESCLNCHSSHSSSQEKIVKLENVEMCLSCHDKIIDSDSSFIESIGPHLVEGNNVHKAISEEGCSTCHNPHVSEENSLLSEPFAPGTYVNALEDNFPLCFRCHDEKLMTEKTTNTATNFRDGEVNLHFVHINGEKGRNCNVCHDVHGAVNEYMIKENTAFGNWMMPIQFKLFDNGGSCLTGCHDESKYIRVITDSLSNLEIPED